MIDPHVARQALRLGAYCLIVIALVVVFGDFGGEYGDRPGDEIRPPPGPDASGWSRERKLEYWSETLTLRPLGLPVRQAIRAWRENHAWAEEHDLPGLAASAEEAILKLDPQNDWANARRDHLLFVYPNFEIDEEYPWDRKKEILAVVGRHGGRTWVSHDEYERLVELVRQEDGHLARIERDSRYRWTKHWIRSTRLDPAYGTYRFVVNERHAPFLVFVQDPGREIDRARVARLAERYGHIFRELLEAWMTRIEPEIRKVPGYETFELPDLAASDPTDRCPPVLKVWIFSRDREFRDYQNRVIGRPVKPSTRGYYRPDTRWVTLAAEGALDAEKNRGQDDLTSVAFYVGTYQLRHYYTKLVRDRANAAAGSEAGGDQDTAWRSHWFTVGLAGLFAGATETVADREWETFSRYHDRVDECRSARDPYRIERGYRWKLDEVVRVPNRAVLVQKIREKSTYTRRQVTLDSLFSAEAWAFCHFLWFAESGKYRPFLIRYLIRELHGASGFDVFKEVFDPICPDGDCSALEVKVGDYIDGL
jgi:hypothetical protein